MTPKPASLQIFSEIVGRAILASKLGYQYGTDRDIYQALGYKIALTYEDFATQYLRQDIARAIIDRPVDATWRGGFDLLESDDDQETQFEKAFKDLYDKLALHPKLARLDRLTGLGKYGILLLGLSDVKSKTDFERPVAGKGLKLLWVKPFGEGSVPLATLEYETNVADERYGQPKIYSVTVTNASTGGNEILRVHYSRVIHVADNLLESEIEGESRLQVVYNRLMDLEKLVGASAEMFWRGARPGHQAVAKDDFQFTPEMVDDLKEQFDEYEHNLRRILALVGVEMKPLAPQVSDPEAHVNVQIQMISAVTGIPKRILTGSELGELASSQDRNNWLDLIRGRRDEFAEPCIIRPFMERCVKYGVLPSPKDGYSVKWADLWAMGEKEKVDVGNVRSTAIKNYASAPGAETVIPPASFRRICLGLSDEENDLVEEELKAALAEEAGLPEEELPPEQANPNPDQNQPPNRGGNGPAS